MKFGSWKSTAGPVRLYWCVGDAVVAAGAGSGTTTWLGIGLLLKEFQFGRAPRQGRRESHPIKELRTEFEDTRYRLRDTPEMCAPF